jgi:hypothetical protein
VLRGVRISEKKSITIRVVRILCEYNLKKRKETKERLQYTVTVLPAPLVPHSHIPVDVIFSAVTKYMNGTVENQYGAALLMFCASRHSFRLYYMRIITRHPDWYEFFSEICYETLPEPAQESWTAFVVLVKEHAWPNYSDWWESYTHAVLCLNGMGLGP